MIFFFHLLLLQWDGFLVDKKSMRRDWLSSNTGLNVVAIGLVTLVFSLVLFFTFQDGWILLTGKLLAFSIIRRFYFLLLAALASLFSALTVFIWRPGFPRIVIGLFSISMASHVIEQFARLPAQQLKLIAFCRIVVALGLVLLFLR
jgi:hypothetical protein